MKLEDLDLQEVYIIGVSGGPDSMALLDMCRNMGLRVVVAHVNYQKRESAKRDMRIVADYCTKYGIPCEIYMQNKECTYNFQAFARDVRYGFYHRLCVAYDAQGVLLAHQMDDHIETYLMQKENKRMQGYLGIRARGKVGKVMVFRPLLAQTKQELEAYCQRNMVNYGIDESNLTDDYARNRMRHQVVEKMSRKEKLALCEEIAIQNATRQKQCAESEVFLTTWQGDLEALRKLEEEMLRMVVAQFIFEHCAMYVSYKELKLVCDLIMHHANQWTRDIGNSYVIYSEYGKLCCDVKEDVSYTYTFDVLEAIQTPYFRIAMQGKSVEALTLYESDFPLTIRTPKQGDFITMRFGRKHINRWFIDRKIPRAERLRYPIVENAQGNVILVPGLGCDIAHFSNNPTCFVVK